jgi:hypothetical protein
VRLLVRLSWELTAGLRSFTRSLGAGPLPCITPERYSTQVPSHLSISPLKTDVELNKLRYAIAYLTQNYISYTILIHVKMRGKSYASLIYPHIHISDLILITIYGYDAAPKVTTQSFRGRCSLDRTPDTGAEITR